MDWTEIATALIAASAVIYTARQAKGTKENSRRLVEIHGEVKNSHTTNQRDDIDTAMAEARAANRAAKAAEAAARAAHTESLQIHGRLDTISTDVEAIGETVTSISTRLNTHLDGR